MATDQQNTEKLTFRVLNEEECDRYELFSNHSINIINRYDYIYDCRTFGELLTTINSHIIKGNKIYTGWISTSKDLINTIEAYAYLYPNPYAERTLFTLVKGYSNTSIYKDKITEELLSKLINCFKMYGNIYELAKENEQIQQCKKIIEYLKQINIKEFSKIILDLSSYENYFALQNLGLITNSKGLPLSTNNSTAPNYTNSAKEVLVYKEIPNSSVIFCSPLVMDLFYIYLREQQCYQMIQLIRSKVEYSIRNNILLQGLTEEENKLYKEHYKNNKTLYSILDSAIFKENNEIEYLISLKESLLKKICLNLKISVFDVKTFEKNNAYSYEKSYLTNVKEKVLKLKQM